MSQAYSAENWTIGTKPTPAVARTRPGPICAGCRIRRPRCRVSAGGLDDVAAGLAHDDDGEPGGSQQGPTAGSPEADPVDQEFTEGRVSLASPK